MNELIVGIDLNIGKVAIFENGHITILNSQDVQLSLGQQNDSPPASSSMILSQLKQVAENHLGQPVGKAVITVPPNFSDGQRQATRDAGEIAGLEVVRIINEPAAAVLAYYVQGAAIQATNFAGLSVNGLVHSEDEHIKPARARVESFFDAPVFDYGFEEDAPANTHLQDDGKLSAPCIDRGQALIDKAQCLLGAVNPDDMDDLIDMTEALKDALASHNINDFEEAIEQLGDLIYFLES